MLNELVSRTRCGGLSCRIREAGDPDLAKKWARLASAPRRKEAARCATASGHETSRRRRSDFTQAAFRPWVFDAVHQLALSCMSRMVVGYGDADGSDQEAQGEIAFIRQVRGGSKGAPRCRGRP